MKKVLLSTVALVSLTAGALAADLPMRAPPPAPIAVAPIFTWTGFYVGVNAGYGFGSQDDDFGNLRIGGVRVRVNDRIDDAEGFVGGGQAGYNYQMGTFVLGLETDIQYADLGERARLRIGRVTINGNDAGDYFGTVRGRAGFAFDRFMIYGTGGFAYGDVGPFGTDKIGWTAGGGVEYAFTNNMSVKVEGLFVSLDRDSLDNRIRGVRVNGLRVSGEEEFAVVRAGLNYRFGTW